LLYLLALERSRRANRKRGKSAQDKATS